VKTGGFSDIEVFKERLEYALARK